MPLDKFLIAPINSGIQSNVRPWLIMEDAFVSLENMHSWRARVEKRYGTQSMNPDLSGLSEQLFTRFRTTINEVLGQGLIQTNAAAFTVPGTPTFNLGSQFSVTDITTGTITIFTVINVAAGAQTLLRSDGSATVSTFDATTGAYSLAGVAADDGSVVYFYPNNPVMALPTYNTEDINDELLFGFDTQFAYEYTKSLGWQRLSAETVAGDALWHGTNYQFHWATNYRGVSQADFYLWVTNNTDDLWRANSASADPIRFWDGAAWNSIMPIYNSVTSFVIRTCKIIVGFKDRLLFFNVTEQTATGPTVNTTFQNRVRFSSIGNPTAATAFDQQVRGRGGFIDADIKEAIISVGFVKDRLIVFFESSTRELVYTGNPLQPFIFQQLNFELGVESQNSIVPFDKVVMGIGSTGIHACNGVNVERIDEQIPSEIFQIFNDNNGPERVTGIRDYFTEEVYWSLNSSARATTDAETFPNRVLIYNYKTGAWAHNTDSITAYGYYQDEDSRTWESMDIAWEDLDDAWESGSLEAKFRNIVCGNQQGFTYIIDNEKNSNSISLSVTAIVVAGEIITMTIVNHNLSVGDFILLENFTGVNFGTDQVIYQVYGTNGVNEISIIMPSGLTGTYVGGGTATLVSRPDVLTKQYNFYNKAGNRMRVPRLDLLVDKTVNGELSFSYFTGSSNYDIAANGAQLGSLLGSQILETRTLTNQDANQEMLWRYIYPSLEGDTVQLRFYLNDEQMTVPEYVESDLVIHAMLFYVSPTSDFGY